MIERPRLILSKYRSINRNQMNISDWSYNLSAKGLPVNLMLSVVRDEGHLNTNLPTVDVLAERLAVALDRVHSYHDRTPYDLSIVPSELSGTVVVDTAVHGPRVVADCFSKGVQYGVFSEGELAEIVAKAFAHVPVIAENRFAAKHTLSG